MEWDITRQALFLNNTYYYVPAPVPFNINRVLYMAYSRLKIQFTTSFLLRVSVDG